METQRLGSIIEAMLYVTGEPLPIEDLRIALEVDERELTDALDALCALYDVDMRGLKLNRFGGCVQMTTRPEYSPYIEKLLQPAKKQSLSQAVMETLSIIAYRQPVTRAEIEAVRGVKCDYSVQSLTNKGLIEVVGRKETVGHPMLYGTTDAFLRHFGIESLHQLPDLTEFTPEEVLSEPLPEAEEEPQIPSSD